VTSSRAGEAPSLPALGPPMLFAAIQYLDRALARCEWLTMVVAFAVMVMVLMAQVLFRYGLAAPLFWAEEVALILMIIMTFTGLSLLVRDRQLVSVDLLGQYLGGRAASALRRFVGLVVLGIALVMAWYGTRTVMTPTVWVERSPTVSMPQAVIYAVFAAESIFLAFHQIVIVVADALRPQGRGHE
jgi:TRAP-type C4-dicarboxylate transport system permease small subunit